MKNGLRISAILVICVLPITVFAQALAPPSPPGANRRIPLFIPFPGPTDPLHFNSNVIHPTMPWYGVPSPNSGRYGNVVGQIQVPAQQVEIDVYVPGPGSFSGEYQKQVVEIPGYLVTETTTGYVYPERWGLQQVTAGVFQWVTLPQQFQPK